MNKTKKKTKKKRRKKQNRRGGKIIRRISTKRNRQKEIVKIHGKRPYRTFLEPSQTVRIVRDELLLDYSLIYAHVTGYILSSSNVRHAIMRVSSMIYFIWSCFETGSNFGHGLQATYLEGTPLAGLINPVGVRGRELEPFTGVASFLPDMLLCLLDVGVLPEPVRVLRGMRLGVHESSATRPGNNQIFFHICITQPNICVQEDWEKRYS